MKYLLALLLGVLLSFATLAQVEDPDAIFYSTDECFAFDTMHWTDDIYGDGIRWIQFRFRNLTTGETIWDPASYSTAPQIIEDADGEPIPIGTCGLGLWQYEIRLSLPNSDLNFQAWQRLKMVWVIPHTEERRPGPPMLALTNDD